MAEPVSTTAAGIYSTKFALSSGLGAFVAAVIVMAMAYPKTKREFIAAMFSTLSFSVFGGAAGIEYFQLQSWGLVAQGMMFILAGLPAWVAVRAFFAWSESNKGAGIVELFKQLKSAWKD